MGADMISQAEDRGEVEIDGETGEGGHAACLLLLFVLVGKDALWHTVFTSLVIGWFRSLILSSLVSRANGVFNYFDGESGAAPCWSLRTGLIALEDRKLRFLEERRLQRLEVTILCLLASSDSAASCKEAVLEQALPAVLESR
jgi:hypothetical protein